MQYIPVKFNKYTNGIYNPQPNYDIRNPDFWSAGILSPEVNARLTKGLNNLGKRYEPQLRYVNQLVNKPIKPTKKYLPRDSIFANFGMIGSQPHSSSDQPENVARVQQEHKAGLMPEKTGGARKTKVKRAKKKRVVRR